MNWIDAINNCQLEEKRAVRFDKRGREVLRFANGEGFTIYQGIITLVDSGKLEGFLDWEPAA